MPEKGDALHASPEVRSAAILRALRIAARQAAIDHKRNGHALIIYRDGKVVRVPPEEIEIPPMPDDDPGQ